MLKSPRNYQDGTPGNLRLNIQEGLDHGVTKHPSIATINLPDPTVSSLLGAVSDPSVLFHDGRLWVGSAAGLTVLKPVAPFSARNVLVGQPAVGMVASPDGAAGAEPMMFVSV
mgnify:CR=1 FL=1